MLDKVGIKQRELGWVGVNVRLKKWVKTIMNWIQNVLRGSRPIGRTGLESWWMLLWGCQIIWHLMLYLPFLVSVSVSKIIYVFLFFSQAFTVCVFDISSYSFLFLISELVLTLDWLCCSVSFVCITYCIVQSSLYLSTRIKDLNSSQDMEFHICVTL